MTVVTAWNLFPTPSQGVQLHKESCLKGASLQAEFLVVHDPTRAKRHNPVQSLAPDEDTQAPSTDARPRNTPSAPPEARPAVHNSFLDEAIKLRDSRVSTAHVSPETLAILLPDCLSCLT
jgi:hypothetical protein